MPTLVFRKCCGCIDLKIGSYIIAYLILVVSLIKTLGMLVVTVALAEDMANDNLADPQFRRDAPVILGVFCIVLIFMLVELAFSIVLLVGLHQNKPSYLKVYLIFSVIDHLIYIIGFIASCFLATVLISIFVFIILLNIFYQLVIRSMYYKMIGDEGHTGLSA